MPVVILNLVNSILGAYYYNLGTGKTEVVFNPCGENGFLCKDKIKVISDVITDEVLLHHYVVYDSRPHDAFVRKEIYPSFGLNSQPDDKEISIDLNRITEIHEISLKKNGKDVGSKFKATVEMGLPTYMIKNTCSVYRVEKDGTYTKLKTTIEDDKIIFETDHFSQYILTGISSDIVGTTPCDDHVYEEEKVAPTCTTAGSITHTCYCGDTYIETLDPTGHIDSNSDSYCDSCGTDLNPQAHCSCNCHKTGILHFFFVIVNFFQKLFGNNKVCACGKVH